MKKASKIAKHLGSNHNQIILNKKDMIECIQKINSIFDEPFADHSAISTLYLSKIAKKNIKVALSGDGSDEQFYGYRRYKKAFKIFNTANILSENWKRKLSTYLKKISELNHNNYFSNLERYLRTSSNQQFFYNEILKMNSDNIFDLSYHDLVTHTDSTINKLWEFCEIPESYDKSRRKNYFAQTASKYQVRREIYTSSLKKEEFMQYKEDFLQSLQDQRSFWSKNQ